MSLFAFFSLCFGIDNIDEPDAQFEDVSGQFNVSKQNNPSRTGWVLLISKAIIPTADRVYAVLIDGYFMCYNSQVSIDEIGKKDGLIVLMDLIGGSTKPTTTSFGKSFGILLKSENMTLEIDANGQTLQDDWIAAIKKEIDIANTKMVVEGDYESKPAVVEWYKAALKSRDDAVSRLTAGTPMVIICFAQMDFFCIY